VVVVVKWEEVEELKKAIEELDEGEDDEGGEKRRWGSG